jgi:hypothetical protein
MISKKFIEKVSKLVDDEIILHYAKDDDIGEYPNCDEDRAFVSHDSFDHLHLTVYCEPEDAIWRRDLQDNYWEGLKVGIRNTLKVLKVNPELLKELL